MRRSLLLFGIAMILQGEALTAPLPPAPSPQPVALSPREARDLLRRHFGLDCDLPRTFQHHYEFEAEGFRDPNRECPQQGMSGARCGGLEFRPSEAQISQKAWIAPVTGHLARNLVVAVSLTADHEPPSSGCMHGVLVLEGPEVTSRRAAFGWYIGRWGTMGDVTFQDVTGDGVLDVLYTYEMWLGPYGRVVARDLWSFEDLSPVRLISSGESLGGVLMGSFEGLPLWWDDVMDDAVRVRGSLRFESVRPGLAALGVFERATWTPHGSGMDFWVMGDFGEGWTLALAGAEGPTASGETGDLTDCLAREVPVDAPLEMRRRLLELETVCRMVRFTMQDFPVPLPRLDRFWAALAARRLGFPMLALAIRERLAQGLPDGWAVSLAIQGVLALADLSTVVAATDALWPRADPEERLANWTRALVHPMLVQGIRLVHGLRTRLESLAEGDPPTVTSP